MGTKVQYKSCFGGYNPMRDLDDDLNANSWPVLCGERNIRNTEITPSIAADVYRGYDKTSLKHKMIEHDAIFKNQVHELHRVYKIQKDMMEEMKRKEHYRHGGSIEPSSSSIQGSQLPYDDVRKSHLRSYPYMNSPLSYTKVASTNGFTKEFEVSEARPSKVRKKLFDLQLPADEHVDLDDDEQLHKNASGNSSFAPCKEFKTPESSMKHGLADLNEPINMEEVTESSSANSFDHSSCNGGSKGIYFSGKTKPGFLSLQKEAVQKSIYGNQQRSLNNMPADGKINGREWFPYSRKEDVMNVSLGRGLGAPHSNPLPFMNCSNDAGTWPQLMQSFGKPTDLVKPKLTSFHTYPSLGSSSSINKVLQSSPLSNGITGDKWHVSSSFSSNGNCKPGVHQSSFPWLRTKPAFNSEATNSRREVIFLDASSPRASSGKSKALIDLNEVYNDTSASNNPVRFDNETNGVPIVKKILGVPIFEKVGVSEHAGHKRKNKLIDINVACDVESEDEMGSGNQLDRSSCARNYIDLNACFVEEEDPPPVDASITLPKKVVFDIDLEALALPEEEEDFLPEGNKDKEQEDAAEDEAMRNAAEAIYKISSDAAGKELLVWFADVVSTAGKEDSLEVMDDFEAMILQLPETKEEDFMPKSFVFEDQKVEETGTKALPIRPRRGQGRRGRQRRDFQRDILPGLVSLSRLEMTEDIQTFGGLMKAMGHSWNSGSTRRNGGRNGSGRGRRRTVAEAPPKLMQQIDNVETSLEKRSLTSWGKTTRRPRRQRCAAGNNAHTLSLT